MHVDSKQSSGGLYFDPSSPDCVAVKDGGMLLLLLIFMHL